MEQDAQLAVRSFLLQGVVVPYNQVIFIYFRNLRWFRTRREHQLKIWLAYSLLIKYSIHPGYNLLPLHHRFQSRRRLQGTMSFRGGRGGFRGGGPGRGPGNGAPMGDVSFKEVIDDKAENQLYPVSRLWPQPPDTARVLTKSSDATRRKGTSAAVGPRDQEGRTPCITSAQEPPSPALFAVLALFDGHQAIGKVYRESEPV